MSQPTSPEERIARRNIFFRLVFGPQASGYVCLSYMWTKPDGKKGWEDHFFKYPEQLDAMNAEIESRHATYNCYFCPQIFGTDVPPVGKTSAAVKENVVATPVAWADLDACGPENLLIEPSVILETSFNRFQALWVFDEEVSPAEAEQISRNIAYHHATQGADTGGWDLTQRIRLPFTANLKRAEPVLVGTVSLKKTRYARQTFEVYKEARTNRKTHDPMPEILPTEDPLDILQKYRKTLNPVVFSLYDVEPTEDWSKSLWKLQMLAFEAGLSREEVFAVSSGAACNKYRRERRHPRLLWEDVCRAYESTVEKFNILAPETDSLPQLITNEELNQIDEVETFVERYIKWASGLGDAAKQYHQAGAFMMLSSLLSGSVRLPTSFGTIMPNLWFMLLADTTLTRKSTAMDIAMDMIEEIDPELLLATDGSLEGMLQSLEVRPGKPSIFQRDEFSGLIDTMLRKDYMAGMPETLTKLYDGKTMKRVLKRETITVKEPCLLVYGAGIKTRVQSALTLEHVASGFIPRFVFITAESDVSQLRPLGPPTFTDMEGRSALIDEAREIHDRFIETLTIEVKGKVVTTGGMKTDAELTPEAWLRYNRLEATLLYAGVNSDQPDVMTPVYDRLSKSILKASVLIAASHCKSDRLVVELEDLLIAMKYGNEWMRYALDVVNGIGRSANEQMLERILTAIRRHPGIPRTRLMQWYHLDARTADVVFTTLEQRGVVIGTRVGRTWIYEPVGRMKIGDRR